MSYQPGRMGMAEGMALVFIILLPRIFLTSPANDAADVATASWWVGIVAGLPAILTIIAWVYILQQTPGDLYSVSEQLIGRVGAWVVTSVCIVIFFLNAALLLRQFAENTLLTALPKMEFNFIVGWYAFIAALGARLGLEVLARGTYLLLPISVFSLLIVLLLLAPNYDIYNLAPWQGYGLLPSLKQGMYGAGTNFGALVLVIVAPAMQNVRTFKWASIFGIMGCVLLKAFSMMVFIIVFGVAVASEKTLPFFEMSRLVYLSRYLQRIESLFIILWVIVGLLGIAISLYMGAYLITRLLKLPALKPLIPLLAYIIAQLAMIPPDIATVIRLDEFVVANFFTTTLFSLTPLLLVAAMVKTSKKGGQSCSAD
ncbi:GerAB/ArcD/ProY family transporter [Sporomusa sp. KB1]|jgi:spore germination protein (amino acid permease)|uniref:GerAB/ArcD/ProY family transporter n=1 Tax=Sporomusa sp. KB1 TaxID=943346 RepID=UPI00119D3B6C|nr:GerAB/ArcD/ProY family transporter [Sporomusa sp. KB1]TWH49038.1 spore germination protein (amino acid permease) [Sporomusa sp. KB1]